MGWPQPHHLLVDARAFLAVDATRLQVELAPALRAAGFEVSTVGDIRELVDAVDPDECVVVILDDADPEWLRAVADLVEQRPAALPVLLARIDAAEEFLSAVTAGVAGLVAPTAGVDAILRTIQSVRRSGIGIPRRFVPLLVEHVRHGRGRRVSSAAGEIDVTDREWEVLQLLLQRRTTKEMADALFVSVGTVRSHVSTLLNKLGAVDREDAIAMIERGAGNSAGN